MPVLPLSSPSLVRVRSQFSDNAADNTNIQIGLVGFVVGLFLVGLGALVYVYRGFIRCSYRRRPRSARRHRRKSDSSKTSHSS